MPSNKISSFSDLKEAKNHHPSHHLFLLDTNTYFTNSCQHYNPDKKTYETVYVNQYGDDVHGTGNPLLGNVPCGETQSLLFRLLAGKGLVFKTESWRCNKNGVIPNTLAPLIKTAYVKQLFEGANTSGTECNTIIALATLALVWKILNGVKIMNVTGHGLGGVLCILVAQEVNRIITQFTEIKKCVSSEKMRCSIMAAIENSPDNFIKCGFQRVIASEKKMIAAMVGLINSSFIKPIYYFRIFTLDPVAGLHTTSCSNKTPKWHDERMFTLPENTQTYRSILAADEPTEELRPIIPQKKEGFDFSLTVVRGNHDTMIGNTRNHSLSVPKRNKEAIEHATRAILNYTRYLLLDFFLAINSRFAPRSLVRVFGAPAKIMTTYVRAKRRDRECLKQIALDNVGKIIPSLACYLMDSALAGAVRVLYRTAYNGQFPQRSYLFPSIMPRDTEQVQHTVRNNDQLMPFHQDTSDQLANELKFIEKKLTDYSNSKEETHSKQQAEDLISCFKRNFNTPDAKIIRLLIKSTSREATLKRLIDVKQRLRRKKSDNNACVSKPCLFTKLCVLLGMLPFHLASSINQRCISNLIEVLNKFAVTSEPHQEAIVKLCNQLIDNILPDYIFLKSTTGLLRKLLSEDKLYRFNEILNLTVYRLERTCKAVILLKALIDAQKPPESTDNNQNLKDTRISLYAEINALINSLNHETPAPETTPYCKEKPRKHSTNNTDIRREFVHLLQPLLLARYRHFCTQQHFTPAYRGASTTKIEKTLSNNRPTHNSSSLTRQSKSCVLS